MPRNAQNQSFENPPPTEFSDDTTEYGEGSIGPPDRFVVTRRNAVREVSTPVAAMYSTRGPA